MMPSLDKVNLCLQMLLAVLVSQRLSYLQFSENPCQPWAFAWPSGKTLPLLVLCVSVKVLLEFWTFLHLYVRLALISIAVCMVAMLSLLGLATPTVQTMSLMACLCQTCIKDHSTVRCHWCIGCTRLRFDLQASALPAYPKEVWSSLHQSKQETEV